MPVQALLQSPVPDALATALDAQGEQEYIQLLSMLQHTQGIFALMLVRSNFTPALREILFQRLAHDLAPIPLSTVQCTRTEYNAAGMLADAARFLTDSGVLALTGLEDTPDMVVEGGKEMKRPPALATLNHGREALRRACKMPIIVWCDEWAYQTLREYAPDFFDHFTGLFSFQNAVADVGVPTARSGNFDVSAEQPDSLELRHEQVRATLKFYESEVAAHKEPTPERARMLLGLAEALWNLSLNSPDSTLQRAQKIVVEALGILSPQSHPYEWAQGQSLLGRILADLPCDDTNYRVQNLEKAIDCLKAALKVYCREEYPYQWAMTQYNIARTISDLPRKTQDNLLQVITYYRAALEVLRQDSNPFEWAMTLNNLGNAYKNVKGGDVNQNFVASIQCYELTLRVFTEADYPYQWATTQYNLGNAYRYLFIGNRAENLAKAIACYQAALRVRTEADLPYDWARVQAHIGLALQEQGHLDLAWQAWQDAARGFRVAGKEADAQKVERWADALMHGKLVSITKQAEIEDDANKLEHTT